MPTDQEAKGRYVQSAVVSRQRARRHQQPGEKYWHPLSGGGERKMKSLLGRVLISRAQRAVFTAVAKGWLDISPSR